MTVRPTAEIVRRWSDELLNDHPKNCGPRETYRCKGCAELQRREFEREAVDGKEVAAPLAEGWL